MKIFDKSVPPAYNQPGALCTGQAQKRRAALIEIIYHAVWVPIYVSDQLCTTIASKSMIEILY